MVDASVWLNSADLENTKTQMSSVARRSLDLCLFHARVTRGCGQTLIDNFCSRPSYSTHMTSGPCPPFRVLSRLVWKHKLYFRSPICISSRGLGGTDKREPVSLVSHGCLLCVSCAWWSPAPPPRADLVLQSMCSRGLCGNINSISGPPFASHLEAWEGKNKRELMSPAPATMLATRRTAGVEQQRKPFAT